MVGSRYVYFTKTKSNHQKPRMFCLSDPKNTYWAFPGSCAWKGFTALLAPEPPRGPDHRVPRPDAPKQAPVSSARRTTPGLGPRRTAPKPWLPPTPEEQPTQSRVQVPWGSLAQGPLPSGPENNHTDITRSCFPCLRPRPSLPEEELAEDPPGQNLRRAQPPSSHLRPLPLTGTYRAAHSPS